MHAAVEHRAQRLDDSGAHAAQAFGQRVGSQQNHRAHFSLCQLFAHANAMAANEVHLQRPNLIGGNALARELAKSGVDAVHGPARGQHALERAARGELGRMGEELDRIAEDATEIGDDRVLYRALVARVMRATALGAFDDSDRTAAQAQQMVSKNEQRASRIVMGRVKVMLISRVKRFGQNHRSEDRGRGRPSVMRELQKARSLLNNSPPGKPPAKPSLA